MSEWQIDGLTDDEADGFVAALNPPSPRTWTVDVCRTCGRLAVWPFCEHRDAQRADPDTGVMDPWFEPVVVVEKWRRG